ncbi:hypothetical protein [Sporosarcina sp. FSL K6-3457]|uniref:hypothetical protein n=1 Tax=Sporosarcina sp. FSL K6-3457 TaxID=2978204 RepID=UPI0030F6EF20
MNTLNLIVKQYTAELGPRKQLAESMAISKKSPFLLFLIIIEAGLFIWFLQQYKVILSIVFFVIFLFTVFIGSYWFAKAIEKSYGNMQSFDISRINKFVRGVKTTSDICLNTINENIIVEDLVKERIERINKLNQAKKTRNIGLLTITVPYLISIYRDNANNLEFIALSIMAAGFIIILFSFRSLMNEYSTLSKLVHISEILKELRLSFYKSERNTPSSLYLYPNEHSNHLKRMALLNQEIQVLWKEKCISNLK